MPLVWNKLCGFISYNVEDVVFIVTHNAMMQTTFILLSCYSFQDWLQSENE